MFFVPLHTIAVGLLLRDRPLFLTNSDVQEQPKYHKSGQLTLRSKEVARIYFLNKVYLFFDSSLRRSKSCDRYAER